MDYFIYKMEFTAPVHFGNSTLEKVKFSFSADTLFSALCIESLKLGSDSLQSLLTMVKDKELIISDAFPYMEDNFFIPKPIVKVQSDNEGDSVIKKAYKKLKYIPINEVEKYMQGKYDVLFAIDLDRLGEYSVKEAVSIRGEEETKPYRVGTFKFNEKCGLYVIVGFDSEEILMEFENLLIGVSYSGIGGERSSGYGRFTLKKSSVAQSIENRLKNTGKQNMILSASLPKDEELENAMNGASYILEKKSGFVYSSNYSTSAKRKKDLYVFKSGSCFNNIFDGDVYDVSSNQGTHSVYKYAIPMFMGVDV